MAVRGVLHYQQSGLVVWRAVLSIAVVAVLAAPVGARLALISSPGDEVEQVAPGGRVTLDFGGAFRCDRY